jgi:hypothetical protein
MILRVPEKECYAIVYALNKLDYLLRDVHFILHTDHVNLTRCYSSGSPKVLRWQILIPGYDKEIRYIKGTDNIVADNLSRFAPVADTDEYLSLLWEEETAEMTYARHFVVPKHQTMAVLVEFASPLDAQEGDAAAEAPAENLPNEIYKKISSVHNSYVGHHGVDRTLKKLFKTGERWPYMREYVRQL